MSDFKAALARFSDEFEDHFEALLPQAVGRAARVADAMRYTALGGGKRLRPFFVCQTAAMFGAAGPGIWRAAAALECIHVYSLVHDDLPCMDDDDLRRGKPTVHRAYDEATAVLCGDALLTHAFTLMAHDEVHPSAGLRLELIADLARASGHDGMVGGQMIDLTMDSHPSDEATITQLQDLKTGALIHYGVMAGAKLGGASVDELGRLSRYARHIGLVFQITDDLLDVEGSADMMGKAANKDDGQGKATFVSILGLGGAKQRARQIADQARAELAPFGQKAAPLQSAIDFVLSRQS